MRSSLRSSLDLDNVGVAILDYRSLKIYTTLPSGVLIYFTGLEISRLLDYV
jgi:hypothetical protein